MFGYIPNDSCNKKFTPSKNLFKNQAPNMNEQTTFWGEGRTSLFQHARYLERTYFQPFL